MAGILSKIASGADRFASELLNPTNALGKLGAYIGAASGGDLGAATLASMRDAREQEGSEMERQINMLRIQQMMNPKPPNNDTMNDYNLYAGKFGTDFADNWLKSNAFRPRPVQVEDPATGEVRTFFVDPANVGGMGGAGASPTAPTAPVGKLTPVSGGPTQPASGGFRP